MLNRSAEVRVEALVCLGVVVASAGNLAAGNRRGQFSVSLAGGKRLVFQPDHDPAPIRQDGGIDWSEVTAVTIVFIGDYHD